jgi:hypothetical protein
LFDIIDGMGLCVEYKGCCRKRLNFRFQAIDSLYNESCLFLFCFKFGFSKDKPWVDPVVILVCKTIKHKINIQRI